MRHSFAFFGQEKITIFTAHSAVNETLIQNNHALQLILLSLGRRDEKLAYPLHSFNSLTSTSCVFYLGISLQTWPSRNENEIVTSIPFK